MIKQALFAALLAMVLSAAAQTGAGAAADAAASTAEQGRDFLVVFSLGPQWVAGKPPGEQPSFREHGQNLKRLREAGRIVLGARYADKGMIVLRAESEAAARAELEADPGVRSGIFTFDLNELRVFYDGFLRRPAAKP
jgi:uncharacterized protein YciI